MVGWRQLNPAFYTTKTLNFKNFSCALYPLLYPHFLSATKLLRWGKSESADAAGPIDGIEKEMPHHASPTKICTARASQQISQGSTRRQWDGKTPLKRETESELQRLHPSPMSSLSQIYASHAPPPSSASVTIRLQSSPQGASPGDTRHFFLSTLPCSAPNHHFQKQHRLFLIYSLLVPLIVF